MRKSERPPVSTDRRQGRRLQPYFVAQCINLRNQAKASPEAVADKLGRKSSAVARFERGETWPVESLELYAAAYAAIAGLDDPRDVYKMSIDTWVERGNQPLTEQQEVALDAREADDEYSVETSIRDLVEVIQHAGETDRARASAAKRPTSTDSRQAGSG